MTMFYPSLMSIKEKVSTNFGEVTEILEKLDNWLASISFHSLERINPYQFAKDMNLNERDVLSLFLVASKEQLFRISYEVVSDENEYLGFISEEQYKKFKFENGTLQMYSRDYDSEVEIYDHNIELWFSLLIKPIKVPENIIYSKKEDASPLKSNELDDLMCCLTQRQKA